MSAKNSISDSIQEDSPAVSVLTEGSSMRQEKQETSCRTKRNCLFPNEKNPQTNDTEHGIEKQTIYLSIKRSVFPYNKRSQKQTA